MKSLLATSAACLLLLAGTRPVASDPGTGVRAFGRDIDLSPYLSISPPEFLFVDQAAGRVYLAKPSDDGTRLAELLLPGTGTGAAADLGTARVISPVDLSRRNFWGAAWSTALGRTIVRADEAGEERINLHTVEPDGQFLPLTDIGYLYGWSLSPDGRYLDYSERQGAEYSPGSIRVIELPSKQERVLFQDSPELRPYWSQPAWRPDGRGFLVTLVAGEDRANQNIGFFALSGPAPASPVLMTDRKVPRELVLPESPWLDMNRFIYISTESGAHELYLGEVGKLAHRVSARIPAGSHLTEATVIHVADRPFAAVVYRSPLKDVLRVLDPATGEVLFEETRDEELTLASSLRDAAIIRASSPAEPPRLMTLRPSGKGFALERLAGFSAVKDGLAQCKVEKVSYRTFDGLSAPGEAGTLHAWLYRPLKPLPPRQATLVVEAFYGGGRTFHGIYQLPVPHIFCAAGIHFLSPAPRGSWTMGVAFRQLIRGDLGGNEILDIVEAGRWAESTLGIPARRIGAFGLSHGGYATMRLLTLPDTVNGTAVDFRYGFGISDAGISNLLRHAGNSNIRGWSVDLMGDVPEKDPAKWLDRSPETHAERLRAPLLLLHGSNDIRVNPIESRAMAAKLEALGKPVTYVEIEGAGHGTLPRTALQHYWRATFSFIERIAAR